MRPDSQLVFDLLSSYAPSLANFVAGRNQEALTQANRLAAGTANVPITYFWGPPASGKSHLVGGTFAAAQSNGLTVFAHDNESLSKLDTEVAVKGASVLHIIDNAHTLNNAASDGLFALFNLSRLSPTVSILAAGEQAPASLPLKKELSSRLAWGLVYALQPLDDDEKALALAKLARERGVTMSSELVPYMLSHTARDMRALTALLNALDQYALARNRALTLPLLREYLQMSLQNTGSEHAGRV